MRTISGARASLLLSLSLALGAGAAGAADRTVEVLGGRKVTVPVPKDWAFEETREPKTGIPTLRWQDPTGEIRLDVSFFPDASGRVSTKEGLEAEMGKIWAFYRDGAVENEKKPVDLKPAAGIGAYMTFTDKSLVGKTLPPGERRMATTGIRSLNGAYVVFTLLSNSRDGAVYGRALEVVRSGIRDAGR